MTHSATKFFGSVVIFLFSAGLFLPSVVDAAAVPKNLYLSNYRYKDEKATFANVGSRCVTTATKALRAKDVKQAQKDSEIYQVDETEGLKKAYHAYLDALEISWEAMLEPYCGFGSHGVVAAQKSYVKSTARVRQTFLNQVKKIQAEQTEEQQDEE